MSTFPGASSSVLGLQLPRRRRRGCHCRHCCLGLGLREAADQSRRAGLPQPTTLLGVPGVLDGCAASKAACVGGVRQNPTERGTEDSGKFWALVRRRCGRVLQHDVVRDAQAQIKKLAPALVQLVLKARHRHGAAAVAAVHLVQPGPKILPVAGAEPHARVAQRVAGQRLARLALHGHAHPQRRRHPAALVVEQVARQGLAARAGVAPAQARQPHIDAHVHVVQAGQQLCRHPSAGAFAVRVGAAQEEHGGHHARQQLRRAAGRAGALVEVRGCEHPGNGALRDGDHAGRRVLRAHQQLVVRLCADIQARHLALKHHHALLSAR
mmetsp:Transcript_31331/g.78507  ORF Transcript_31331/g.78507 Transcript_31331/m.78507 type:complete len:324 (+) Transcript_31331:108-1079(+)